MSDGGKGSAPRPVEVPRDEFNRRWEETFGKKQPAEKKDHLVYTEGVERQRWHADGSITFRDPDGNVTLHIGGNT